jgi:alkyl sulfatase BDS1-like metallo-beta-lactamase superfamily hydrolase
MYEQLGYQYESNSIRNSFLAAASELRRGLQSASGKSASPDVVRAMPTGLFLDFLGVRVDSTKANRSRRRSGRPICSPNRSPSCSASRRVRAVAAPLQRPGHRRRDLLR